MLAVLDGEIYPATNDFADDFHVLEILVSFAHYDHFKSAIERYGERGPAQAELRAALDNIQSTLNEVGHFFIRFITFIAGVLPYGIDQVNLSVAKDRYVICTQRKLLQDRLDSLVVPEGDATLKAGELIENLGLLCEKATLEEKHELLASMLEAVYVDLLATRSIVGIQPEPAFYPLFDSLKEDPESKVIIFDPNQVNEEDKK